MLCEGSEAQGALAIARSRVALALEEIEHAIWLATHDRGKYSSSSIISSRTGWSRDRAFAHVSGAGEGLPEEVRLPAGGAREICAWVLGAPPSGPLLDDLQKIPEELGARTALAAYHGASSGHPELDLGSLVGESSSGQASANALVLAGKLEPITAKIAQGLPYVAVRDVRRAEQELDVADDAAESRADAPSSTYPVVPSSGVDPPVQE